MKRMKKFVGMLLALMMLLALTVPAVAADNGSITINGVNSEITYSIYRLLDLESYDTVKGAYSYKVNSAWTAFFATDDAKAYITIDDAGYVTWKAGEDDATVAAFAKLALAYAKANDIAPVKSSANDGDFVITGTSGGFSGLPLGYYLVDSTAGALCGLTTTNPDASINAKNGSPTIDKQVQEDSTSQWGDTNTADIGQTVHYRVTINVQAGAENYVLHDVMGEGLTFKQVTTVEHKIPGSDVAETANLNEHYTVVTENLCGEGGCNLEIQFTQAFCDHLEINDKVIVSYEATLNSNAVIAGEGNKNTAWLSFGEGLETEEDYTTTKTYAFDIVKTDSQNTRIDGAHFKIYDAATGGTEIKVIRMGNGSYRPAGTGDSPEAIAESIVVTNGQVRVVGFDNGTYYLEETVAPSGYNKLTARQKFIISDSNLDAVFNGEIFSTGSGVHVVNKTGTMLPETGGMGTTLFITFGMLVALGTGVLLVTKKRMAMIQE